MNSCCQIFIIKLAWHVATYLMEIVNIKIYFTKQENHLLKIKKRFKHCQHPVELKSYYKILQNGKKLFKWKFLMNTIREMKIKPDRKSTRLNSSHVSISYAV